MAQTQTLQVKIDAAINAEATLKTLRELKQLQKETVAGSADYKKIQARINDIGDAAKMSKTCSCEKAVRLKSNIMDTIKYFIVEIVDRS